MRSTRRCLRSAGRCERPEEREKSPRPLHTPVTQHAARSTHSRAAPRHTQPTRPPPAPAAPAQAKITKLKNAIAKKQAEHDKLLKVLQESHGNSQESFEKLKAKLKPEIKLLAAATPKAA